MEKTIPVYKKISLFCIVFIIAIIFATVEFCSAHYWMGLKYGWLNDIFEQYLRDKNDISDQWMTFMTILSTFFAVFFIYSGFKIDADMRKVSDVKENIMSIENEVIDNTEFSNQLQYAIHYMMSRQYNKALDALIVLRSEGFTLKNDRKLNSCNYFLAVCYYEQALIENNDIEKLAKSVQFINEAIEENNHPLKQEIIEKFNEVSNSN